MSIADRWRTANFSEVQENAKQEAQAAFRLFREIPALLRLFSDFVATIDFERVSDYERSV